MTFIDEWYGSVMSGFMDVRGAGGLDSRGVTMPLIYPLDTIAALGQVTAPIRNAIAAYQSDNDDKLNGQVVSSDLVASDGTVTGLDLLVDVDSIAIADYVAGYGMDGAPWRRAKVDLSMVDTLELASVPTYEPWRLARVLASTENNVTDLMHSLMAAWQRAVNGSAACLRAAGANLAGAPCAQSDASEFLVGLRQVCTALDVLGENPPMTADDKIRGATRAAITQTETYIGEAAATLASEAGKLAGNVTAGFFGNAGILTVVVAGIAVYLFVM